ncbi:urease subunit beta [Streptomyces brevispora]|uniref:urease subunit beta n=1 Tax=Streptomyces brevispora TaxID=887462 RepID=UPI0033EE2FD6
MIPGEIRTAAGVIHVNSRRRKLQLTVVNDGDRPIQVGSHFHFLDVNPALSFDRSKAGGFRLDIPSGTSLRFEPGVGADITLVEFGGRGTVPGIVVRAMPRSSTAEGTAAGAAQDAAETKAV